MPRLIDADALMNVICEKFQEHYGNTVYQFIHDFLRFVVRQIRKAPTIDAVPVVRCKDCKRSTPTTDGFVCGHALPTKSLEQYFQTGTDIMAIVNPDDFCSYGERKEGAE